MPNIKFNYFYRCSGNCKKAGSVTFDNLNNIELHEIEALIKSKLIDETWFYANDWGLPEVFTEIIDFRIDPTWHEFESIEYTNERATVNCKLSEFQRLLQILH